MKKNMDDADGLWRAQMKNRVRDVSLLPRELDITPEEEAWCRSLAACGGLPLLVTPYFVSLLCALKKETGGDRAAYEALRMQVIPSPQESIVAETELDDPLGEALYRAAPRLVHQYKNRALLLSCGACVSCCRHCFRRTYTAREAGFIGGEELDGVCAYLRGHAEINEILVSGGDPLCACDGTLVRLFERLREARPGVLLRVCTRAPVFLPSRFTGSLVSLFRSFRPLWLIPHINHPAELTDECRAAICSVIDAGVPVQSQTVLLRGVNDSVSVLTELFTQLVRLGVKPGYLFQADLAPGTSHLRVSVDEGLVLYEKLGKELSGLSLPVYAVDLPGGGGKYNLCRLPFSGVSVRSETAEDRYRFYGADGGAWEYPRA